MFSHRGANCPKKQGRRLLFVQFVVTFKNEFIIFLTLHYFKTFNTVLRRLSAGRYDECAERSHGVASVALRLASRRRHAPPTW